MKFENNNKYFTIAVYIVASTLVVIGIGIALMNIQVIWGGLVKIITRILELLKPLIIGIAIAYLLDPIVEFYANKCKWNPLCRIKHKKEKNNLNKNSHQKNNKLEKDNPMQENPLKEKNTSRTMGTFLTVMTLIAIIGLFILIIALNVNAVLDSKRVEGLMAGIHQYIQYFQNMLENITGVVDNFNLSANNTQILGRIYGAVDQITTGLTDKILETLKGLGGNAISIGLGIVVAFYLVQDKPRLLKGWNKTLDFVLPGKIRREARNVGQDMDYVFSGYIRGQLIDAVIMAVLTSLALTLIRLDFAIIIGIIAGVFNIIPYFGPVVGFVLAGIIGSIGPDPQKGVYAMVAVLILQQIDGWFIVPKVIGNSVKLHPVVVLLAIVIGGELFGLLGILLGVPIAAFIRVTMIRYMGNIFE
ncbi:MAG: AI-2E family transporter [Cellulosilyticaceae bacterium]